MVRSVLWRQVGAVGLCWLTLQAAWVPLAFAAPLPKVVVVPFADGSGAPERAGARFAGQVRDELDTRTDALELIKGPQARAVAPSHAGSHSKPSADGLAALAEGKRLLEQLQFEPASMALERGLDAVLADPARADFAKVEEGLLALAVANFRMGEEKRAQGVLLRLAKLDPHYKLPDGYPPIFFRELDKALRRAEKLPRVSLTVSGPPGSTAFINGRDLGMVPVDETLPPGTHYVKVEGTRGELFGQAIELKTSNASVTATFNAADGAPKSSGGPVELKISESLTEAQRDTIAAYARSAGAEFALVGLVYATSEHQLSAATALYSARKGGFSVLPLFVFDREQLTSNVEAFRLADEVAKRMANFGATALLPVNLAARPSIAKGAESTGAELETALKERAPLGSVREEDSTVRSFARHSRLEEAISHPDSGEPSLKQDGAKGVPAWVWVAVGVGALAAAGGTYYGVSEVMRPVTGQVTARW